MLALEEFQQWVSTLPEIVQYLAIILLGCVPYVESYAGSIIGVLAGLNPLLAILFAVIGNILSMLVVVLLSDKINQKFGKSNEELSPRRQKFNKRFEKYGVIGTAMLGWTLLPSQVIGLLMVSVAKVEKAKVIFWISISIIVWGTLFGLVSSILF